jgi:hypothetical protein
VPINENCLPARLAIISSQNDRITASGMYLGVEACPFEALYKPIRTRFNVGLELSISRYGRKPKKLDQTIYVVSHYSFLFAEWPHQLNETTLYSYTSKWKKIEIAFLG